jgi:mono/diheme cytochrome c family protein
MRWPLAALLAATGLATAACGSSGTSTRPVGQKLFSQACGGCHTLSGRDSPSHQGGDLLHLRLARPVMLQFAAEMPLRHRLSDRQLAAVTDYLLAVQRQRG